MFVLASNLYNAALRPTVYNTSRIMKRITSLCRNDRMSPGSFLTKPDRKLCLSWPIRTNAAAPQNVPTSTVSPSLRCGRISLFERQCAKLVDAPLEAERSPSSIRRSYSDLFALVRAALICSLKRLLRRFWRLCRLRLSSFFLSPCPIVANLRLAHIGLEHQVVPTISMYPDKPSPAALCPPVPMSSLSLT